MPSQRLLYLAHRLPYPPDKGDKIRSWNELKALADEHDVTLAAFVDDPADLEHVPFLREVCREVITVRLGPFAAKLRSLLALAGRGSLSLAYYRSGEMRARLAALEPFDVAVGFSSTMGPYLAQVPAARRVLDLCDLDSAKWAQYADRSGFPMSWVYRTEARRLGRYEEEAARTFDAALLVSGPEADELRARARDGRIEVVPNGVDLAYFDPEGIDEGGDGHTLVFCGAMDYRSNVDAVVYFHRAVLPLVRERVPDARFRIVGSNPAPEVTRLAEDAHVDVTGRVPDVRPELLSGAVSVAPMRLGRGVPNKVLEALALTMPVVCTPNAAASLDLAAYEGARVAGDDRGFADAVCELLAGPHRFAQHRQLLSEQHSWESHLRGFRAIVLGNNRPEAHAHA